MKKVAVLVVILLIALSLTPVGMKTPQIESDFGWQGDINQYSHTLSSALNSGMDYNSLAFMTRSFQSQSIQILNSYSNPASHIGELDFTDYLISGWDLYNVTMEIASITAIAERESTGVSESTHIDILNDTGSITDVLYQAFYNQAHDGKLENYSLDYQSPFYTSGLGDAYLVIRSDYSDPQTNETDWLTPFSQVGLIFTTVTDDCSSQDVILDANVNYYAVIDGTGMEGFYNTQWYFNTIYWRAANIRNLVTGYHIRDLGWYLFQGGTEQNWEADFRYTYTPWNTTSDSALIYADPSGVSLNGNTTALTGKTWTFSDNENITSIEFVSNQSVEITFNMTLNYRKSVSTSTLWSATTSGQDIDWNATTSIDYPSIAELKYLNVTVPSSWAADGLYNIASPSTNHSDFENLDGIIRCRNLVNGTWTLTFTSRNYLSGISTFDDSDDSEIISKNRIDVDIAINSTLTELDLDPVTTGTTNLTIQHQGATIWAPVNQSVTVGTTYYLWEISASSTNGIYRIEQFWANGTEAGYRTKEIVLYYPTTLAAAQSQIDGFTESTVDISIDFDDVYTPQGLDGTFANVVYSFDGGANTSLIDQSGGTWTASVSTAGKSPGLYALVVYAEGYALENQSTKIDIDLIHDTKALTVMWSNTNDISYVETTELSVAYDRVGNIPVSEALVEVTIGTAIWQLNWDGGSGTYKIVFNGTDVDPGFGSHNLTINASRLGYESQSDTTETLDVHEESTIFNLEWTGNTSITYVESVTLYVDYQMSNTTTIPDATVEVTIDSDVFAMNWNDASKRYWYQFNGSDLLPGFGIHSLTIEADKFGYQYQNDLTQTLTITEESTTLVLSWSNGNRLTYVTSTTLFANYTQSDGNPVTSATVNVSIGSGFWVMTWNPANSVYEYTIGGSDTQPGFGTHGVIVLAGKTGFVDRSNSTLTLTVSIESSSIAISWSDTNSITFIEQTTLIVSYKMSNDTPIIGATINVTISGIRWDLQWHALSETYRVTFQGSDVPPGYGIHNLTIRAGKYGYENHIDTTETLTLSKVPTNYVVSWSNTNSITFIESTTLIVNYTMSNGSPVTGATINVTIEGTRWDLFWDGGTETYQVEFLGSDEPPGFGTHNLTIRIGRFGYENYADLTETLTLIEELTSMVVSWSSTSNITYIESTTLIVAYRMSDLTSIPSATVRVTINSIPYPLIWHPGTQTYQYTFTGADSPPGFGTHALTIDANRTGFETQSDTSKTLILRLEPTTIVISWSNTNSITYIESTILIVNYTMSDGSPVTGATVNATIGGDRWDLIWDGGTETYRMEFSGSETPPGLGIHNLTIRAGSYGYENHVDATETLTLSEEPTSMYMAWLDSPIITYLESTTLIVNYQMSDTTPISGATVTATIEGTPYLLIWHSVSHSYRYNFSGSDNPPGIGIHMLTIDATKMGFVSQSDIDFLTINQEPTSLIISWSNTNTITFVESTILIINFTMNNGTPVTGAIVNATIGGTRWDLIWNIGTETYQVEFFGSDIPPGFGTHSITIRADKFGYVSHSDVSQNLTLESEPTTLIVNWIPDDDITFVTYSILSVSYRMSDTTPISGAIANVTIGGALWLLKWSIANQDYRLQINGSDVPPGFGIHSLDIRASKFGFDSLNDSTHTVTLREEPTSLSIQWSNGNDIGFYEHTFLFVDYRMTNLTTILGATLNVTINGHLWPLTWNATENKYQVRFEGSDTLPGVGTHSLIIRAGKPGYIGQVDSSQILTLPVIPTTLSLVWVNTDTISYVGQTTLRAIYQMYNTTPITGATLNVTIDSTPWTLVWNFTTQAYEHTFIGSDNPPGFGTHLVSVQAWKEDFQSQNNSIESLTVSIEVTSLDITWTNGNNISYHSDTTLSVAYLMSDTTPIDSATVNATIGGALWILTWNPLSEAYETTIYGSDAPPGFGTHSVFIEASRYGFEPQSDSLEELTLRVEDTSLSFDWISSNVISYVNETTLRIFYSMSNTSPVTGAIVNVTIDTEVYTAIWNGTSEAYEVLFRGMDTLPGLGIHSLIAMASKENYQEHIDSSQSLSILEEQTSIAASWTDGNDITYSESTTLYVHYSMSNGTEILDATVKVTIGPDTWSLSWDVILELYKITFIEAGTWPGLGSHGLSITANKTGYKTTIDILETLTIHGEFGNIESYWIGDGTITFVESDTLVVNYTIADGTAISGATVNVTIDGTLWDLAWHAASETYRITFNGTDIPPGMGSHGLIILADRVGYDGGSDTTKTLNIIHESTTITVVWSNSNNISYFEYTYLFVTYSMSNGSKILGALLNVTIHGTSWNLVWNSTQGAYGTIFYGSDNPPGLGTHSLEIQALKYGFAYINDTSENLILEKDSTTLQIVWSNSDSITFVESTTLIVYYQMSNGTPIQIGTITATIGSDIWSLVWNSTTEAYHRTFNGDMDPPGIGFFSIQINATSTIFATQLASVPFSISEEPTSATASWINITFDWTQNVILGIDYIDSYGRLVGGATQKAITIDGSPYTLRGTNGTYWMEFNNTFGLGFHNVVVNISKYGYEYAVNSSISFNITNAGTNLVLVWNFTTIDYLEQISLSANYTYSGTGESISVGLVEANITIDGTITLNLIPSGNLWTITLDGDYLDLGSHNVVIKCQAYGYDYAESSETLVVTEVSTISSVIIWTPSNLTIEYTESLELVVYYTYSGGDVPVTALVNATINGHFYELLYTSGAWRVTIPGNDLGVGIFEADISAWLHGYELRTFVTSGINVTLAANSFIVTWEPLDLTPTYIDQVNLSVIYTEDFLPILGATVRLYINGSDHDLIYSTIDEMWHFSINAATIDLGVWNVTVTANKTGYTDGFYTGILTVVLVPTTLSIQDTGETFYFDETTSVDVHFRLLNLSSVPSAGLSFTLNSIEQATTWNSNHWNAILNGTRLGIGTHTFTISVSAYGYQTQSDSLIITILAIPTSIIGSGDFKMFARESVTIRFTYIDDRTSTPIYATDFEYIWSDFYFANMLANYTDIVTIGGSDFHVGNYTFQINLGRLGFDNSTDSVEIEVIPISTQLIHDANYFQYENETITLEFQFINSVDSTSIDWGSLTADLEGVNYVATYVSGISAYRLIFRIPLSVDPGTYALYLNAEAEDCHSINTIAELEVLSKREYLLSITVSDIVHAGERANVSISVTEDSLPVAGIYVTVTIVINFINGEPQTLVESSTSNIEGRFMLTLDIPSTASELEVSASFQGSITEWAVVTSIVHVDVTPASTGTGPPIGLDPLTIGIVTGCIGIPFLALAFRRRRRGSSRISAAASITPSPPIRSPATSATGMLQKVMDEIKSSEDGITRAELSRRLGPSASKIGIMVKDLLDTELGFFEIRDGAKKLIKFKDE